MRDHAPKVNRALSTAFGALIPVASFNPVHVWVDGDADPVATSAAIELGREQGARVAVLEASDLGQGVYRRMGFAVVTEMRSFVADELRVG